jgi:hypothetical protein
VRDCGSLATADRPAIPGNADLSLTDSILWFKVRRGAAPTWAGPFDDRRNRIYHGEFRTLGVPVSVQCSAKT